MTTIVINVGGIKFQTGATTLTKFPGTKLSKLSNDCTNEHFFDRNPYVFSFILDGYRYGTFHIPHDICSSYVLSEIEFWEIPTEKIGHCCLKAMYGDDTDQDVTEFLSGRFRSVLTSTTETKAEIEIRHKSKIFKMWELVNDATSSKPALVYAVFLFLCVFSAVVMVVFESSNMFRENYASQDMREAMATKLGINPDNPKVKVLTSEPTQAAWIVGLVLNLLICLDTVLRLIFCPKKLDHFRSLFNIADIMHMIGFVLIGCLFETGTISEKDGAFALYVYIGLRILMCFEVIRMFRLILHFKAIKVIYMSLMSSCRELGTLMLCVFVFITVLGPLVFIAELTADGNINDVFTAFWWALVTMTTIGYGDHYPVTTAGRLVGAVCAVLGVLVLAMPVGILATTINDTYSSYKVAEKHYKRQQDKRNHKSEETRLNIVNI